MRAWWHDNYSDTNKALLVEHFGERAHFVAADVIFMRQPVAPPMCSKARLVVYPCTNAPTLGVETLKLEPRELDDITPTVELTWQFILRLTRPIDGEMALTGSGMWDRYELRKPERMLSTMELCVAGQGRIGQMVGDIGKAFNMTVTYRNSGPSITRGCQWADVITIHTPPLPIPVLDWPEFRLMKRGVVIVNTAQGNAINLDALRDGLESGLVAGAALDVLPNEFDGDPIVPPFEHPNLLLTPHIGGSTQDAWERTQRIAIDKALKYLGMV